MEGIDEMFQILFKSVRALENRVITIIDADFVPYTGAIQDVDLGAFDLTTTGSVTAGTIIGDVVRITGFTGSTVLINSGTSIIQGPAGTTTTVLHGNAAGAPTYGFVIEDDQSLSNVATWNATTGRHGYLPILPGNAAQFLDGNGNYTIPGAASISQSYSLTSFSGQTSVNVVHNFNTYPVVQVLSSVKALLIPFTITHNTLNDFTVTFITSTTGTILATVGSPQPQSVIVVSSNYTVLSTDRIVKVTASAVTITLPTAVGNTGREFNIDNSATGAITVNTTSSQTIEDELSQVIPADSAMTVYSDGVNYRII
jgi:hypothetical protein